MSGPIIRQWAAHYINNMKLHPVPLLPRSKEAFMEEWNKTRTDIEAFHEGANIGIRSVNGLVVFDDDCPTPAVACADEFLPWTGAVWGRPQKPRSKRLFSCPDLAKTVTFRAVDKKHMVQLRVGQQDMAPPSIHPNGERLKWDGLLLEPARVDEDTLVRGARHYWTARLIADHWPARNRHECRLAFARVLLETLGLREDLAVKILEWGCRLGGSDDRGVRNVEAAIRDTRKTLDSGEPATGGRRISELLPDGRAILRLLRQAYGKTDAIEDAVEELNERFAVVGVSNKVVVMETWPDRGIKELWPFAEFRNLLIKERIPVDGKEKPLADVWLKSPHGRQYDRLVFLMPGSTDKARPNDYNGWLGFRVRPQPGDWSKNCAHIRDIICNGNDEHFEWVMNWMAALVQFPGRHAFAALVLRGGEGTGKGHFAHLMLGGLFHKQQYLHIIGSEQLTGRFNEHLSGKVLVYADESTWGGDPKAADKLKGMVTESTVPIERKFLPLVEEPSMLHIVMASNNEWPVAIPMDDRRYMVLDVSDSQRQNDEHFEPLRDELASGGYAAMLHDLLHRPLDEHALRHPLSTSGKREVTTHSLKPIQRWWFEHLKAGYILRTKLEDGQFRAEWPEKILKSALHSDLLQFLGDHNPGRQRSTQTELGIFLKRFAPVEHRRFLVNDKQQWFWVLPPLEECRARWLKACGWADDYNWNND